ncbi:MAG TPA: hypothetical protein VGO90_00055 [Chthoniobacteraceae bacterium]|jgi:hypothetical protein|nr:hypothetical protein [Chthoniobacteraceae bacterium]
MIFRRVTPVPTASKKRRLSPSFLVSVGVHTVVAIALMRMLILNGDFTSKPKSQTVREQRVGFVRLSPGVKTPTPARNGGDGRRETSRAIHVVAPTAVPTTIAAPSPSVTKTADAEGLGPIIGTGGPSRGIRPQYSDPRVWEPPGKVVGTPKTVAQAIDSIIVDAIAPYNDSVAAASQRRDPTDWTIKKGGYKWGMDSKAIRLGPLSIPTALLAMLPLNITGNPQAYERNRAYAAMNRDINWHAQQAINEADFMKAVRGIRERKERERAAALAGSAPSKDGSGDQRPHD